MTKTKPRVVDMNKNADTNNAFDTENAQSRAHMTAIPAEQIAESEETLDTENDHATGRGTIRNHEHIQTKTNIQRKGSMNGSVIGTDLRNVNNGSNYMPCASLCDTEPNHSDNEESIMAADFEMCNDTHTNDTFAVHSYEEY